MSNDVHPYAAQLAARVGRNKNNSTRVTFRKLLNGFGYKRRTERAIEIMTEHLAQCGLASEFDRSVNLDDVILVSLVEPIPSRQTSPLPASWPTDQIDLADLAERALAGTVSIFTEDGLGAGFIAHPAGLVVTARHVVAEGNYSLRSVKVGMVDDRLFDGVVFASHRQLDFALIWLLDDGPFPTIPIADAKKVRLAQTTLAIGSPNGLHKTVSRGIVANPRQLLRGIEWIQTDAAIHHGNSGGPLVTHDGVVGINLWGLTDAAAARFALPLDYIQADIDQAIKHGKQKCLAGRYCPACGFIEYKNPSWYCRNCGIQFAETEAK